jgi:single-strand DNA-binding protein
MEPRTVAGSLVRTVGAPPNEEATVPALDHPTDPAVEAPTEDPGVPDDRNEVHLIGRVSGRPERRTLPSGDELVALRVVVRRPASGVDTLDVAVGPAPPAGARRRAGQVGRRLLATADRLEDGERIEVTGALRRRWWGSGGGRQSRVEVRAGTLTRAPD